MRDRFKKGLTSIATAAIAMTILHLCGAAVAQENPNPDLSFKTPEESRLFGREVPDVGLRFADGGNGRLSDLWTERPVFVTLVFSRCAGICSPYLGLLKETVERVGSCGDRYQMVVISFDVRDNPEDVRALAEYHGLESDPGWTFAVPTSSKELAALCQSLDFDFRWDEQRQQFNHPAITVALRAGKFVRLSVGEEISPRRFKDMLADAWGEFVSMYPEPGRRGALFRCFDYDPERGFSPNWGMLIIIFPSVAALSLAAVIFKAARLVGRRSPRQDPGPSQAAEDAETTTP
jgi:cytochrome oxidase Cu insertion factor (SCO1/SenC/PrrC family)